MLRHLGAFSRTHSAANKKCREWLLLRPRDLAGEMPFFLGSVLAVAYFLGITSGFRALAGRPVHLGLVWPLSIALYFGWFCFQIAIGNERYHPTLFLMLCMIAAFKTLRLQEE